MKMFLRIFLLFLLFSCSSAEEVQVSNNSSGIPSDWNPSGTYEFTHGGRERVYHYYEPKDMEAGAGLIFVLHGYSLDAKDLMDYLDLRDLADEHGFAIVYPQGAEDNRNTSHWNANLSISNVNDVDFLSALAQFLQENYNLDPNRTFTCGYSNGGFMSYELVLKKPDVFKAAASVNGTMSLGSWEERNQAQAVPILQISGALDRTVPINGIISTYGGWGGAPPIWEILSFWAEINRSDSQDFTEQDQLEITKYKNSQSQKEVWYYLVKNLDHRIPLGGNYPIDATTVMWEFFSLYY